MAAVAPTVADLADQIVSDWGNGGHDAAIAQAWVVPAVLGRRGPRPGGVAVAHGGRVELGLARADPVSALAP